MYDWAEIRRHVLFGELSKRAACREYDLHWSTLVGILHAPTPPGYRHAAPRAKPKLGPFLPIIHRILDEDRSAPTQQPHRRRQGRRPAGRCPHGVIHEYQM